MCSPMGCGSSIARLGVPILIRQHKPQPDPSAPQPPAPRPLRPSAPGIIEFCEVSEVFIKLLVLFLPVPLLRRAALRVTAFPIVLANPWEVDQQARARSSTGPVQGQYRARA